MTTTTFAHLDDEAQLLVDAPDEERIRHIRANRYIEHSHARRIREYVDVMMQMPRSVRPECVLISADSNAGKSTLFDSIKKLHAPREQADGKSFVRPVISCSIEPYSDIEAMQKHLLRKLGAPRLAISNPEALNDLIMRYITELDVRVLLYDEVQHVLHRNHHWRGILMDQLKWFSCEGHVNIVAAGTPGVETLLRGDAQLSSRFTLMALPRWTPGASFGDFLDAYERSLPLRRPSNLRDLRTQKAIHLESGGLHSSKGVLGGIVRILREAATAAIRTGREAIAPELLGAWRTPHVVGTHPRLRTQVLPSEPQLSLPLPARR